MPLYLPEKCLRCRTDCEPLAQIESDDGVSFICVGHNDGTDRAEPGDQFTLCWKNGEVDERGHWDDRDLIDTASVILQALSADRNGYETVLEVSV